MTSRSITTSRLIACLAVGALTALLPAALSAQDDADFLFRRPVVSLTLRGGYAVPQSGSEIFEFTTEQLTVDAEDFNAFSLGGEIAWRATERVDVALSVDYARSETASEFNDWVDLEDNPITQTTTFWRAPVMLSVKGYLFERGRSISRFAWVPTASWSPYVGVGGGWTAYGFEQQGDFVDVVDLDIFRDHFVSEGSAPTAHVLGGATFSLGRRWALTAEGRYAWASADLDADFVDFEPIDLGGFQGTVGISLRF